MSPWWENEDQPWLIQPHSSMAWGLYWITTSSSTFLGPFSHYGYCSQLYLSWFCSYSPRSHPILLSAWSMLPAGAALTLIWCQCPSDMTKRKGLSRPSYPKLSRFLSVSVPSWNVPCGYHHCCHLDCTIILWLSAPSLNTISLSSLSSLSCSQRYTRDVEQGFLDQELILGWRDRGVGPLGQRVCHFLTQCLRYKR